MHRKTILFIFLLSLWLLLLSLADGRNAVPAAAAPLTAPADTPQVVTTIALTDWWVSDGLIYYTDNCSGGSDEFRFPGYAHRLPTGSNTALTLATFTKANCFNFRQMMADGSGLYYFNGDSQPPAIEFRASADPLNPVIIYTPANPVTGIRLRVSGDYLYWIENNQRLVRVRKDGTDFAEIATGLTDPLDFVVVAARQEVYWMEASGLWKTPLFCGTLPCAKTIQTSATANGGLLLSEGQFGTFTIYWPELSNGGRIRSFYCGIEICWTSTDYQAPATPTLQWGIGTPAFDGASLFWQEVGYDTNGSNYVARIRRMTGGVAQTLVENLDTINTFPVYVDRNYVYYYDYKRGINQQGIRRLPLNASIIARDVGIQGMEVTQGVQNLANEVELVADKPTFVRVLGTLVSGSNAFNVEGLLYGKRSGVDLPGSPLRPIQRLPQFTAGVPFIRDSAVRTWLFELPPSWRNGNIDLQAVIDPRNAQSDPALGNNSRTQAVAFLNKAPICVVLIPVRTHTPNLYATTTNDPIMAPTLDLAERLLPMSELWPFYSSNPVEEWPGGQYAPFEMGEDNLGVLTAVNTRAVFSSNPRICNDADAETLFAGIVPAAANAKNGVGGMGHFGLDSSWTALSTSYDPNSPYSPFSGQTFAHELGHNFSRLHVDCGDPSFNDLFYPYDDSLFADGSANGYYGFDAQTKTSIAPQSGNSKVADLMSYCPPRWTSDYTWKALMGKLSDRSAAVNAAATAQFLAGSTAYVSGSIGPDGTTGALDTTWIFANATLGNDLAGKWQRINANRLRVLMQQERGIAGLQADTFHLRLFDSANNLLGDLPVTPTGNDHHGNQPSGQLFVLTFPVPETPVARIELRNGETVLAAKAPGSSVPTVILQSPTGGSAVADALSVAWLANDSDLGDTLLGTVQYSPDLGQTWYALLNNYAVNKGAAQSLTLDTSTMPGSAANAALLRVSVSDGYNTAAATSQPFTMADHNPLVTIMAPATGTTLDPQSTLILRGIGVDPEEGGLPDAAHTWKVDGTLVATGKESALQGVAPGIHHVELTAQDTLAHSGVATTTMTVAPLQVPLNAETPTLDGHCDDASYSAAALIGLATYSSGEQANVRLVRSNDHLWVCFSGLLTDTGTINSAVHLWLDLDQSGGNIVQAADLHLVVDESGGVGLYPGDGAGGFATTALSGAQARINVAMPNFWDAEVQIDATLLGGWGHLIGLAAGHTAAGGADEARTWPRTAQATIPTTWGTTVLGVQATLGRLTPATAIVGSAAFTLSVTGDNFLPGALVLWQGQPLTTAYINTTTLQAQVIASLLVTPQPVNVQVRNPQNPDSLSASFVVEVPTPSVTTLTPATIQAGASKFTLTITGSNFVNGAQALWNSAALSTTLVSNTELRAEVPAALVQQVSDISVAVANPLPGRYSSNAVAFTIQPHPVTPPTGVDQKLYLPMIRR